MELVEWVSEELEIAAPIAHALAALARAIEGGFSPDAGRAGRQESSGRMLAWLDAWVVA